ncbi:MAG: ABC transporter ATP-binding protein [Chloroflexota bacterium]
MHPLRVESVGIRFGGLQALEDVSFTMEPGERRVIIGPNGAGKTTLFNVISGQLRPSAGAVQLFDQDVTRMPPYRRAGLGLARTFQITNLFPNLSVFENLMLAVQALTSSKAAMHRPLRSYRNITDRTRDLLEEWQLWSKREELARHLSYGDQRELEILMALAGSPKLLLLDEPTAGLSTAETHLVVDVVRKLDPDITILLIEHDLDVAFELANRVMVLHQGRLLLEGTPDEVKGNAQVAEIYLGVDDVLADPAPGQTGALEAERA